MARAGPEALIVALLDDFQDYRLDGNWSAMLGLLPRDGLIWRIRILRTREDAFAGHCDRGLDLGL